MKAAGLDKISPEVWKTRKFDDLQLRYCNAAYNQITIVGLTIDCILPFPKKVNLRIGKNCWCIHLTSMVAKIYKTLLLNRIQPEIEKILQKNQNDFQRN